MKGVKCNQLQDFFGKNVVSVIKDILPPTSPKCNLRNSNDPFSEHRIYSNVNVVFGTTPTAKGCYIEKIWGINTYYSDSSLLYFRTKTVRFLFRNQGFHH